MALTPKKKKIEQIIPWNKIKAEYLLDVKPRELAKKYNLTSTQISDKAKRDKWKIEKDRISQKTPEKVQENLQETITQYSKEAIETLHNIMTDPESENKDKISSAKAILDISGLKTQEIKTNQPALTINFDKNKFKEVMADSKNLYE